MQKSDKIKQEIKKHEIELIRLRLLLNEVSGCVTAVCPFCNTENLHWNTDNKWCCAFC